MQQAQDLIDGLMLFRFGASRRNLTSMTLALMNWVLYCSHGLRLYDNLGRVRPVSQAYYESEKLFFGGALGEQANLTILLQYLRKAVTEKQNPNSTNTDL